MNYDWLWLIPLLVTVFVVGGGIGHLLGKRG